MTVSERISREALLVSYGLYRTGSDDSVDAVLASQFVVSDPDDASFQAVEQELHRTNPEADPDYYGFLVGQLSYLHSLTKPNGAQKAANVLEEQPAAMNSIRSIYLYLTYLLQTSTDTEALTKVAKILSAEFVRYPSESKALERHYLVLLLDQLYALAHGYSLPQLVDLFAGNYNLVISVGSYFQYKSGQVLEGLEKYIHEINTTVITKHRFPRADETSDAVENFIVTVSKNTQLYSTMPLAQLSKIVTASFEKSFQNVRILKNYIMIQIRLGKVEEIRPTFDVYAEYVDKSNLQHGGAYIDILDVIDCFSAVLEFSVAHCDVAFTRDLAARLENLLHVLYDSTGLQYHDRLVSLSVCLQEKVEAVPLFVRLISRSWAAMALAYKKIALASATQMEDLSHALEKSSKYFQHCLACFGEDDAGGDLHFYYEFAVICAKSNRLKDSIKLMKICCLHDKENFRYWNFLTLLYSTEENYTNSETLINNSILLLNTKLEEDDFVHGLTLDQKKDILQLKMTQISLIELMNKDTAICLQVLPELFTIYHRLFEDYTVPSTDDHLQRTESSKSLTRKNLNLKKILSKPSGISVHRHQLSSTTAQPGNKAAKASSQVLQMIWLWSATLYLKAGSYKNAEESIVEAENVHGVNSHTRSKFAMLLLLTGKCKSALKEFEVAIQLEETNVEAILGLSRLVFDPEDATGEDKLFVDATDREAAELRLKLLLEPLSYDYRYCQITEISWYLSAIHEKYQDLEQYQKCLWRCIELEENKPVRGFENIEHAYLG